jgi:hypothetical protein
VIIYQTIWHHIPEENNFHTHCCKKPQLLLTYLRVAFSSNVCTEDCSCSDDMSASFKASKLHATSEQSLQTHKNTAILQFHKIHCHLYCLHPVVYYYIVLLYNHQHNKFVINNQYYCINIYLYISSMFRFSWIITRQIFMKCIFVLNCHFSTVIYFAALNSIPQWDKPSTPV